MELEGTGRGERSREGIESATATILSLVATIVGRLTFISLLIERVKGGSGREGESEGWGGRGRERGGGRERVNARMCIWTRLTLLCIWTRLALSCKL